jgi:hypothetical protein
MKFPVAHVLGAQRNGVNHVSMNTAGFDRPIGPVRGTDYPLYPDALLNWYQAKRIASVRLMFTWEAVQSSLQGPIPAPGANYANYWTDLTSVVTRLLARHIYVTLAPWQFNGASGDTDIVYNNASFTPAQFADFWAKFATAINGVTGNDQRVAFDLINEPHTHAESGNKPGDIGISLNDWFLCAQAAITAVRSAGVTNTILVPGMAYTAASSFTTNGSAARWATLSDPLANIAVTAHCYSGLGSANATVLRNTCNDLVSWARTNNVKVHIGEIAIDAGSNGRATFCSTFATAQAQWSDWQRFCLENDDVIVGWNWWGNSTAGWWNEGDSCDPQGYHWGLTLTDGASQTVYMNLIETSLPTPRLTLRDSLTDIGEAPDTTVAVGWESPDVWVRQVADGITVGEPILGGQPSVAYVRVGNVGEAPYPTTGTDVVRLFWAKAQAGLSWPQPWNGAVPSQGGAITTAQPIGAIGPGQRILLAIPWPGTPNPADYPGNDGHFCLLAQIAKGTSPQFDGFQGPDLNLNVLQWSDVAWRNIHIVPVMAEMRLGDLVVTNQTDDEMLVQISFALLDDTATVLDGNRGQLLIAPRDPSAEERLRDLMGRLPILEDLGHGTYRVLELARGIPELRVRPAEALALALTYAPDEPGRGYALRATQTVFEGVSPGIVGGQTFVVGEVDGFSGDGAGHHE